MTTQLDLHLDHTPDSPSEAGTTTAPAHGYDQWQAERQRAREALAGELGLPLGHRVRVEFAEGSPLEGMLSLAEETLFLTPKRDVHLALRIGPHCFCVNEISACVRLD
jgi:hypothetical protein